MTASDKLRVWDFKGNLLDELVGHEAAVTAVRFAPNGTECASGSDDASVRLWPVAECLRHAQSCAAA